MRALQGQELAGGAAVRVKEVGVPAEHAELGDHALAREVGVEGAHEAGNAFAREEVGVRRAGLGEGREPSRPVEVGGAVGHEEDEAFQRRVRHVSRVGLRLGRRQQGGPTAGRPDGGRG